MFSKSRVLHGSNGSGEVPSSCSVLDVNLADRIRLDFLVVEGSKSSSVGATLQIEQKHIENEQISRRTTTTNLIPIGFGFG